MSGPTAAESIALQQLYRRHQPWLTGWLQRRMGCGASAADLAQDTFIKVLLARQANHVCEPRAFLTAIARRLLSNHYRRQRVERAYLEALTALPEHVVPSEEMRALALETLLELDRRLASVPRRARQVFVLSQLEGCSHAEIASKLGISIASVKRDLTRAAFCCCFDA